MIILDTCVILDALQDRKPYSDSAKSIFLDAADNPSKYFITANSVTDIAYIMHKYYHNKEDVIKTLKLLTEIISIVDTCAIDCEKALYSGVNDYEDAVMCETALRNNAKYIITRNTKDYVNSTVPIITPDEYVGSFA